MGPVYAIGDVAGRAGCGDGWGIHSVVVGAEVGTPGVWVRCRSEDFRLDDDELAVVHILVLLRDVWGQLTVSRVAGGS